MSTVHGDPEAFMTLNLSRNLNQGANPAYQLRDGFQTQSCMKADFTWDQEEVSCATFMAGFAESYFGTTARLVVAAEHYYLLHTRSPSGYP